MIWFALSVLLVCAFQSQGAAFDCTPSCDIKDPSTNCSSLSTTDTDFFTESTYYCTYYIHGSDPTDNITVDATVLTSSNIICNLPNEILPNSQQYQVYYVRVWDGGGASEAKELQYLVYDSRCVTCNSSTCQNGWTCQTKSDICVIGGRCYQSGDVDPEDNCKVCTPKTNSTAFLYKRDTELACKVHGIHLTCSPTTMTVTVIDDVFITDTVQAVVQNCDNYTTTDNVIHIQLDNCADNEQVTDEWIIQSNTVVVKMSDILPPIRRELSYTYNLECRFNRQSNVSSGTPTLIEDHTKTFDANAVTKTTLFDISMSFHKNNFFNEELAPPFQFTAFEPMYIRVEATNMNDVFKIVVQECYATATNDINSLVRFNFFEDKCALDPTYQEYAPGSRHNRYDFSIEAFTFIAVKGTVYLHCKILICKSTSTSDECRQQCNVGIRRRRRATSDNTETTFVRSEPITYVRKPSCRDVTCPAHAHCVDLHPAHCRCDKDHVRDVVSQLCTNENLFTVTGVRLNTTFFQAYTQHSSSQFQRLAINVENQLENLFSCGRGEFVRGLKVINARPGSVIIDLLVARARDKTSEEAFDWLVRKISDDAILHNGASERIPFAPESIERIKLLEVAEVSDSLQLWIVVVVVVVVVVVLVMFVLGFGSVLLRRKQEETRTATQSVIVNDHVEKDIGLENKFVT